MKKKLKHKRIKNDKTRIEKKIEIKRNHRVEKEVNMNKIGKK